MTNQIVFFGAGAAEDYGSWHRISYGDQGELAYRINGGAAIPVDGRPLGEAIDVIRRELKGGGILLALTMRPDQGPVLKVHSHKPHNIAAPTRIVQLAYNGAFEWQPLSNGHESPLRSWDCALVPVSARMEDALDTFLRGLEELPPTTRASLLYQLVLPTLENRIARLEQLEASAQLFARLADTLGGTRGGAPSMHRRTGLISIGAAVLVMALALVAWWTLVSRIDGLETRLPSVIETIVHQEILALRGPGPGKSTTIAAAYERLLPDGSRISLPKDSNEEQLLDLLVSRRAGSVIFDRLRFEGGVVREDESARQQIRTIATILLAFPQTRVEVGGFSDSQGSEERNLELSEQRAAAVMALLRASGVPEGRMTVKGYGEESPIADNNTDAGRIQNRRVELKIVTGT